MKKGILLLFIVFSMSLFGDGFTSEDILNSYEKVFSSEVMDYKGKKYVSFRVKECSDPILSGLTKSYHYFLSYLLTNSDKYDTDELKKEEDPKKRNEIFVNQLKKNEKFNNLMLQVFSRYLISKGHSVPFYKPEEKKPITIEEIKKVAVRFFYPHLGRNGKMKFHICAGINGFKDFDGERNLLIEAFAFAAIFNDLRTDSEANLSTIFSKLLGKIMKLGMSNDKDINAHRIQGAAWFEMSKDKNLEKALINSFKVHKFLLPFKLEM